MIQVETDEKILDALEFQPPCEWQTRKMTAPCGAVSGWILTLACCGESFFLCTEHMEMQCRVFHSWRRSLICGVCDTRVVAWHWEPIGGAR